MTRQIQPVPGNYYVNFTGQLLRVRCLLYLEGRMSRVLMEYLDGRRFSIAAEEWHWLDLAVYSDWFQETDRAAETEREI